MYRFAFKPLPQVLDILQQLDDEAAPEIALDDDEVEALSESTGKAVLCYDNDRLVAGGYWVPAQEVASLIQETDELFDPGPEEVYIYSIMVTPDHRGKGLSEQICQRVRYNAREYYFKEGSIHARMIGKWPDMVRSYFNPYHSRVIEGFWPDLPEPDVEFLRFVL